MTDTAKPTYAFFDNTNKNTEFLFKQDGLPDVRVSSELVHELALVTAQTNLTPRQLLERVRELEAEQAELVQFFTELANDSVVFGLDTEFGDGFSVGVKTVCDAIKAAIGKHGEKV